MLLSTRRALLLIAASMLLSSCVAEMVDKRKPRKGPIAEVGYIDQGGGEVRYSVEGWGWLVSMRRKTALRRMRGVCGELKPRTIDEYTREDADTPYSKDDMSELAKGVEHFQVAPFRHIVFDCAPQGAKTP